MRSSSLLGVKRKESVNTGIIIKCGITVVAAFLLANSTIGGVPSPLITSFAGAVSNTAGIFVILGALVGYLVNKDISIALTQVLSLIIVVVIKIILTEFLGKKLKAGFLSILTGVTYFVCGIALVLIFKKGSSAAVFEILSAVLCGCATYFYKIAYTSFLSESKLVLTGAKGGALACFFVLFVTVLCSADIVYVNLGRIFAFVIVLVAARNYRFTGGTVCGALASCGIALYSGTYGMASMLLAVIGMVAGVFSEFGQIATALFFIGSNIVGIFIIGVTPDTAKVLVDVILAAVIFAFMPEKKIMNLLGKCYIAKSSDKIVNLTASKLEFAAHTIADVKSSVEQIAKALEKNYRDCNIIAEAEEYVCHDCRNNMYCWEKDFDKTSDAFEEMGKMIEVKQRITIEEVPAELSSCYKKSKLIDTMNSLYHQKRCGYYAKNKIKDMQGLLYEQFSVMEEMLFEISGELMEGKQCDEALSRRLINVLIDLGAKSPRACIFYDSFGHLSIEAFYMGNINVNIKELLFKLSEIVDRELDTPEIVTVNGNSKLSVMETPKYRLEIAAVQKPVKCGQPSGDTCEYFFDGHGNAYFVISDGMGTGKAAAVDSMMTANILIRLLKAGIGYKAAVKLVNSSVLVKSSNESFATLDIACINLYTGKLDIMKLGAAETFVKSSGMIKYVESATPPVGILEKPVMDRKETMLKENDIVVMVSDGLGEQLYPYIKKKILDENIRCEEITNDIISKAAENENGQHGDDISIYVIKLCKNETEALVSNKKKVYNKV